MSNIRTDLQLYSRIPDPKTIHDERYNPNTYISVQSKVNNDRRVASLTALSRTDRLLSLYSTIWMNIETFLILVNLLVELI